MTHEEELRWIQQYQSGDPPLRKSAQEELLLTHLGLIKSIAGKVCQRYQCGGSLEDLTQEGVMAFLETLSGYDAVKGVKLAPYAYWGILGAMLDYLREESGHGLHISTTLRRNAKSVREAHDALINELQGKPTLQQIAAKLGKDEEEVEEALGVLALTVTDMEGAEAATSRESFLSNIDGKELQGAIGRLRPEWQRLVTEHDLEGKDLKSIAKAMGENYSTIKVWHKRAKEELKKFLKATLQ